MDYTLTRLLEEVARERRRQDEKFGHQDYPLINPFVRPETIRSSYASQARVWKQINDQRIKDGERTGEGVLIEEVFEALSADSPEAIVTELVQVAAVALLLAEMEVRKSPAALPDPARHVWNGADRFHGICRCGQGREDPVHLEADPETGSA